MDKNATYNLSKDEYDYYQNDSSTEQSGNISDDCSNYRDDDSHDEDTDESASENSPTTPNETQGNTSSVKVCRRTKLEIRKGDVYFL